MDLIKNQPAQRILRSLALNVYFKHPELGMKEYEILSRATAFLLSVDPPDPHSFEESSHTQNPVSITRENNKYQHLATSERQRQALLHKQDYSYEPAGGKVRPAEELRWLEFCPGNFRPRVHVVASSHVLSPWLWKKYYPQPWLDIVTQDHVRYSVDVLDGCHTSHHPNRHIQPPKVLAKFALQPYPIHHPSGLDLAIVHLKQEESSLQLMKELGVQILHLSEDDRIFQKNEIVELDGYEVAEDDHHQQQQQEQQPKSDLLQEQTMEVSSSTITANSPVGKDSSQEDTRIFLPYQSTGRLIFASHSRFLASTDRPLPEGLCGGPVMDTSHTGRVCGVIEGVVPMEHPDRRMAGAASFIPSLAVREFLDHAERIMLERILPKNLFDKVVEIKDGKGLLHDQTMTLNNDGSMEDLISQKNLSSKTTLKGQQSSSLDQLYHDMVESMKKSLTPEQVDAVFATVERERQEVIDILQRDGGDLDTAIEQVRAQTRERQAKLLEELSGHGNMNNTSNINAPSQEDIPDAQVISTEQPLN